MEGESQSNLHALLKPPVPQSMGPQPGPPVCSHVPPLVFLLYTPICFRHVKRLSFITLVNYHRLGPRWPEKFKQSDWVSTCVLGCREVQKEACGFPPSPESQGSKTGKDPVGWVGPTMSCIARESQRGKARLGASEQSLPKLSQQWSGGSLRSLQGSTVVQLGHL